MSAAEIDAYLQALAEPRRCTLTQLRETIPDILADADQGISYGAPAFKVGGKTIAGFAAFTHHLSYLPHSGSVFVALSEELDFHDGTIEVDLAGSVLPTALTGLADSSGSLFASMRQEELFERGFLDSPG